MPNDTLQDLIETLKKQGVERGEKAGREVIDSASRQADDILAKARAEAAAIEAAAREESEKQMKRLQSSMEIAASQFVNNLKGVIEENLLIIPLKRELNETLGDSGFMKTLIARFVETYAGGAREEGIELLLPKGTQEKLKEFALELMMRHYGWGAKGDPLVLELEAQDAKFGFQVNRKDGHVRLDFSDEAFLSLFLGFLTPKFRDLFKGVQIRELHKK
jgi:V/A-type H+/Na+-transporting ATPase subunit E